MEYIHYEDSIVEKLEVELVGLPLEGYICNPGTLKWEDAFALKNVLANKQCKWVSLTKQQVADRKASNKQRLEWGKEVYGPPWKKRVTKTGLAIGVANIDRTEGDGDIGMGGDAA